MSIEAMKLALATLEKLNKDGWILADFESDAYASIDALRAAIEQAEKQEPVAWMYKGEPLFDGTFWHDTNEVTTDERVAKFKDKNAQPLYTAPPQREWQGLRAADLSECGVTATNREVARAIEAKLKEKNGCN